MTPNLRKKLVYNQAYWINLMSAKDLESEEELNLPTNTTASRYDVFGTANFFNFRPLTASIEYLLKIGIDKIQTHNDVLVKMIIDGMDATQFELISPSQKEKRSALLVFSHKDPAKNSDIFHKMTAEHIYGAFWRGNIRIAPHLFNTREDIQRLLVLLNSISI